MRNRLFAAVLCTALSFSLLTGCSSAVSKLTDTAKNIAENSSATATPSGPTPTPAPKETAVALKKSSQIGDWKFTVSKVEMKKKVKTSTYMEARPDKGNLLVIVSLSATNKGKEAAAFLPRVGREDTMMTAKLIYKNDYEYLPSVLTGYDKDIAGKNIEPLAKKSGVIAYNVPAKVAKDLKSVKIRIGTNSEAAVYSAK